MQADLGWGKKVRLSNVSLQSPKILGEETLASAASVSTSENLWQVVRGLPYDLFAEKAWLDNSLAASGQLKWSELLDYVRLCDQPFLTESFNMTSSKGILVCIQAVAFEYSPAQGSEIKIMFRSFWLRTRVQSILNLECEGFVMNTNVLAQTALWSGKDDFM